jgi:hypothetical protein
MYYVRVLLGKQALVEHHGVQVYRASRSLREMLKIDTIYSTLRVRRLQWLQTIASSLSDALPLLAVLCAPMGNVAQLDETGEPTEQANPWLKQWYADLVLTAHMTRSWSDSFSAKGFLAISDSSFLKLKFKKFLTCDTSEYWKTSCENAGVVEVVCSLLDVQGQVCARCFLASRH